ncbi:MAG: 50S ribosomal protein L29 [Rikenellaceae bacterium]|jgi:large subunit ribosomal protein L29|nr:50S ribosomal protein L29 [Bacteroidales bacterium]
MKTKEVRELSINDLKERIEAEKANLLHMKMNHAISPIDDLSKMKKSRKDIARMLTILTQKQNIDK